MQLKLLKAIMLKNCLLLLLLFPFALFAQVKDADISSKLALVQNRVPLDYSAQCKPFVQEYVSNYANRTGKMLERFNGLDAELKSIFTSYNVPIELRFAALSLSNCDNTFTNQNGSEGVFMLDYLTAQKHGLYISNYVDERRDPLKAAAAFCLEMNQLYTKTGDWRVAITQYVSGQLEWQKAISKVSDSFPDYNAIANNLPYQYRTVYPKYLAAVYIANYYKNHNISGNGLTLKKEEVPIGKYATLFHLADKLDIDHILLKELNPIYKKGIIPSSGRDYFLVIPSKKVNKFYELGDEIYDTPKVKDTVSTTVVTKIEEPVVKIIPQVTQETKIEPTPPKAVPQKEIAGDRTIIYQVRRGDAISIIADYYDCYVSDIKRWNGLRSTRINYGQRLKIVIPASKYDYYIRINKMSSAELNRIRNKD